jgi:hypothetical protein
VPLDASGSWVPGPVMDEIEARALLDGARDARAREVLRNYLQGRGVSLDALGLRQRQVADGLWEFYKWNVMRGREEAAGDSGWFIAVRRSGTDENWKAAPFGNGVPAQSVESELRHWVEGH